MPEWLRRWASMLESGARWVGERLIAQPLDGMAPDRKLLLSAAIVVAMAALRWLVLRIGLGTVDDARVHFRLRKSSAYIFGVITAFLVLEVWFPGFENLATYLGLVSAGVAIALRDPIANLAGWAYLFWRRPFKVGDRIEIGSVRGDVVDMRLFEFTLNEIGNWVHADQSTGRVVHIPNLKVFNEPLASYTRGLPFVWNEVRVPLTYDSDWATARELLLDVASRTGRDVVEEARDALRGVRREYLIFYRTLTPTVYMAVEDRGIVLTIRHLVRPRQRRGATHDMWQAVLEVLAGREDIRLAWPTRRVELAREQRRDRVPAEVDVPDEPAGAVAHEDRP